MSIKFINKYNINAELIITIYQLSGDKPIIFKSTCANFKNNINKYILEELTTHYTILYNNDILYDNFDPDKYNYNLGLIFKSNNNNEINLQIVYLDDIYQILDMLKKCNFSPSLKIWYITNKEILQNINLILEKKIRKNFKKKFKSLIRSLDLTDYQEIIDDNLMEIMVSFGFNKLLSKFSNNKSIVLKIVKLKGSQLKNASDELKNDKIIVYEAIKQNGKALEYASGILRNSFISS